MHGRIRMRLWRWGGLHGLSTKASTPPSPTIKRWWGSMIKPYGIIPPQPQILNMRFTRSTTKVDRNEDSINNRRPRSGRILFDGIPAQVGIQSLWFDSKASTLQSLGH